MMKDKFVLCSEFCESVRDGTHDTPKRLNSGYRLVTSKHIKNGYINADEGYFISEKDFNKINERSLVEKWDVLMSMIGTIGEAAIVKDQPNYAIKNVALFKCGDELRAKWLYYYLCSSSGRGQLFSSQKGASQQFISLTQLRNFRIPIRENSAMKKVTDVLSTYDDLIENNQKQIKLLEEAAMKIYKEWFVDLRFPGHETTEIVDGVPKGWNRRAFKDICQLIKSSCKAKDILPGTPYIGLEHIPRRSICLNLWGDSSDIGSSKYRYIEKDVLFGKIRPYFHKVGYAINNGVCSTDAMVFRAKENMFELLITTAFSSDFVAYSYSTCREGAKMPRADLNEMGNYPVLIPPEDTLISYNKKIGAIIEYISVMVKQSSNLSQARDKLIPKLMSGEIEV